MPGLHFEISAEDKGFQQRMAEIRRGIRNTAEAVEDAGGDMDEMFSRLAASAAKFAGALGIATGVKEFVFQLGKVRGEFQQLEIAFGTMLGSAEKADALMRQLVQTAAITPFDLQGVANGAKQLLAYGTAAEEVNETITRLGDIAAGLSIPLGDLVYLYGTTMTQGRMFTQDLRQFMGRGIPMADELAKQFGVAKDKVGELVTAGRVGAEQVKAAIWSMTDAGGKFGGLMEAQSKSITGQVSNIQDAVDTMLNDIGKQTEGAMNAALSGVSWLIENYKAVGETLLAAAAVVGTYKAAVATLAAVENASATARATRIAAMEAELAAVGRQTSAVVAAQKAEIAEIATKYNLTQAEAAYVVSIQTAAKAKVDKAAKAAASAQAEVVAAEKEVASATAATAAASQNLLIKQEQYRQAVLNGNLAAATAMKQEIDTAATEHNTAASAQNAAAKRLEAAQKRATAATTAAETAAKQLDSVQTDLNTKKTGLLTLAKTGLRNAAMKLHAVLLANPYALVAAAVAALAYGIYKLATYETEAEKAQKRFNKAVADADGAIASEQANIELLFSSLRRATEGTKEYEAAKNMIVKQYGDYLQGLIDEKGRLLDVEAAYLRVSAAARDAANARAMEAFTKEAGDRYQDTFSEKIDNIYAKIEDKIKNHNLRETIKQLVKNDIDQYGELMADTQTVIGSYFGEKRLDNGSWRADSTVAKIKKDIKDIADARRTLDDETRRAQSKWGVSSNEFDGLDLDRLKDAKRQLQEQIRAREKSYSIIQNGLTVGTYRDLAEAQLALSKIETAMVSKKAEAEQKRTDNLKVQYDKTKKELDAARADVAKIRADMSAYTQDDLDKAQKRVEAAEAAFKAAGGDPKAGAKYAKAADERVKAEERAAERLLGMMQDNAADQIALMEDGRAKRLAQIDAEYDQRIAEVAKRQKELAELNKKAGTDGLDADGLTAGQQGELDLAMQNAARQREKARAELLRDEAAAMRDYLKEYGTFQQQKLAIAEEYAEKIRKAQSEGERLSLERERDSAIAGVNTAAIRQTIDWAGVFGNFGTMLNDEVKSNIKAIREYMKTDEYGKLNATDQSKIAEALEELMKHTGGDLGSIDIKEIGNLADAFHEAEQAWLNAKQNEEDAYESLADAQNAYDQDLESGDAAQIASAKMNLDVAKETANAMSEAYHEAANNVSAAGNRLKETTENAVYSINSVTNAIQKIKSGSLASAYEGIQNLVDTLSTVVGGSLRRLLGDFGNAMGGAVGLIVGSALELLDVLKDGIGTIIANLVDMVMNAVNGILDDIFSGDIIMKPLESVYNGIGGILNTITFGGFSSWISGGNGKWVQETTERLTDSNERLRNSVDKLTNEIADSNGGIKAIEAARQAEKDQQKINEQTLEILKAQMGYHGAHHSNSYYWGLTAADYASLNATLAAYARRNGKDASRVGSLADIYKLSPEEMDYIRTYNIEMWERMLEQGKYDKSEYWEQYADLAGQLEEIEDALRETLTQTSFDSLRDSFVDTLMDMDATAEDFADDFSEYMMRAILNARMADIMDDELKDFYGQWADYAESGNELTDWELGQLQGIWDGLVDRGLALRDQVAAITGYGGGDDEREASRKGIASASQESVDELNGRATAIQGHTYTIAQSASSSLAAMAEMSSVTAAGNALLADLLAQSAIANGHLAAIERQSLLMLGVANNIEGYVRPSATNLADVMQNVKSMKETVNDMALRGVKIQ